MRIFLLSEGDAILIAMLGGILYLTAIIFVILGLVAILKPQKSEEGKQFLITALVLFIIGTGVCGFASMQL